MEDDQVITHDFRNFDEMLRWMEEHHGEYSAFMAAERKDQWAGSVSDICGTNGEIPVSRAKHSNRMNAAAG